MVQILGPAGSRVAGGRKDRLEKWREAGLHSQHFLRQAGHPSPAELWPGHLHFIIQPHCGEGGAWGETAQQKQLLSLSTVLDQSLWHTSSPCDTGNEEESSPSSSKKKKILKIKGFDAYPEKTCFSIFATSVSVCVKDGKCQGQ